MPVEHTPVNRRARAYAFRVFRWLEQHKGRFIERPDDACEVVPWFHFLIGVKINRALTVWPDESRDFASADADGSAKVALIGIERSHAAWLSLVERGTASAIEAEPFIADLVWLAEEL